MSAQDPASGHANEPNPVPEAAEQAKSCFEAVLERGPKIETDHYLVYTTRVLPRTHLTYSLLLTSTLAD